MIPTTDLSKIEHLVARIPFHLDDVAAANEAFKRWRKNKDVRAQQIIDIWTYCYVWRNLLIKFSRNPSLNRSDFDLLVTQVFERIVEKRDSVRDETRYANWVSVICRNSFVNYLRGLKRNQRVRDHEFVEPGEGLEEYDDDFIVLHQLVQSAVQRLPTYLQRVVRMRLFDQKSYDEISVELNRKVEVIRSYFNKAMRRLREDRLLVKLVKRDFREDIENEGMP